MNAFLLGAYACGAVFAFILGLFVREPIPSFGSSTRVPLWEIALYAAAWPYVAVWVVLAMTEDAR